jgi:hypothetical protein
MNKVKQIEGWNTRQPLTVEQFGSRDIILTFKRIKVIRFLRFVLLKLYSLYCLYQKKEKKSIATLGRQYPRLRSAR